MDHTPSNIYESLIDGIDLNEAVEIDGAAILELNGCIAGVDKQEYPSLGSTPEKPVSRAKKGKAKEVADVPAKEVPTKSKKLSQRERREGKDNPDKHAILIESCFQHRAPSIDGRQSAINSLSDKEKLKSSLVKTRMCHSVEAGKPCPHGETCRFAHTPEELRLSLCLFDSTCRFVRVVGGTLENVQGCKVCHHKHTKETNEQFTSRVAKAGPKLFPKPAQSARRNHREEETVLRVPMELAEKAMEMAMVAGNRNIRVEII